MCFRYLYCQTTWLENIQTWLPNKPIFNPNISLNECLVLFVAVKTSRKWYDFCCVRYWVHRQLTTLWAYFFDTVQIWDSIASMVKNSRRLEELNCKARPNVNSKGSCSIEKKELKSERTSLPRGFCLKFSEDRCTSATCHSRQKLRLNNGSLTCLSWIHHEQNQIAHSDQWSMSWTKLSSTRYGVTPPKISNQKLRNTEASDCETLRMLQQMDLVENGVKSSDFNVVTLRLSLFRMDFQMIQIMDGIVSLQSKWNRK